MKKGLLIFSLCTGALVALAQSCKGDDSVTCGKGTTLKNRACVASSGGAPGTGGSAAGGDDAGPPAPKPPEFTGVAAVAPASKTSLFVAWSAATDNGAVATDVVYRVYVGTSKGGENFATPTVETPANARFVEVTGLTEGTEYFVVVRALRPGGPEDKNTVEKSGKPGTDSKAPTFAGAVSAKPVDATSVQVSWAAGSDDLTAAEGLQYVVYASDTAKGENFSAPSAVSDPGATSAIVTGLPNPSSPAKTYFFVVRARDAFGNTDSNTTEVSSPVGPDTTAPTFGGCLLATATGATSAHLTWRAGSDDATPTAALNYLVFASKTPGTYDFTVPQATFTGVTAGDVQKLDPKTQYYFVCRAADGWGNQDSNKFERSATTLTDSQPPTFGGATGVTNVATSSVEIDWAAATDDQTAQKDIVYEVFESATSNGEDFTKAPKYTSDPGATSISITGLQSRTKYYWIVRARDQANNVSQTTIEVSATTLVSFKADVVAGIFAVHCALTGCHSGASPTGGMDLSVNAWSHIVNVPAQTAPSAGQWTYRIHPNDLAGSYMYAKITDAAGKDGTVMPPPSQLDPLTQDTIDTIKDWILQGALNN